jgi:TolB-like protein/Tfp pilus assembly protein PilF
MKKCPRCSKSYADDTLNFCLDDGSLLIDQPTDEPATAILRSLDSGANVPTQPQIHITDKSDASTKEARVAGVRRMMFFAGCISLLIIGGVFLYRYVSSASSRLESIAVMPFVNDSGNSDVEFLSEGMTETLINSLIQLPNLSVKSRDSAFRYKGREADAKTIGRELGVGAILNGRIIQRGDELTLFLSLVDTASENQVWGKRYDRKITDLVALQNEIARDVSASLKTKLTSADEQRLTKGPTDNSDAYQLYLKGQYLWHRRSGNWLQESLAYYQQALEKDPNFALAYVAVADTYIRMSSEPSISGIEAVAKARPPLLKALEIDKDLAEAHRTLAELKYQFEYDWGGAEQEFRTALELNPNVPLTRLAYGWFLMSAGRFPEADKEFEAAVVMDPGSLSFNVARGRFFYFSRQYDRALQHFQNLAAAEPENPRPLGPLQDIFEQKHMYSEAFGAFLKGRSLGGMTAEQAAEEQKAFDKKGWEGFLSRRLDNMRLIAKTGYVNPAIFAGIYARLGDKEKAFENLEKAIEEHDPFLVQLKIDPRMDNLRDDPRYETFLGRVGLTK